MMFKSIALLKKKAGLTRQQFIDYYENNHAPLIVRLTPGIRAYHRNFIDWNGMFEAADGSETNFDCVTEVWFDDRAAYEKAMAVLTSPDVAKQIADDEEHVFDRSKTRMFVVDETKSPIGQ